MKTNLSSLCIIGLSLLAISCKKPEVKEDTSLSPEVELNKVMLMAKRSTQEHQYLGPIDPFMNSPFTLPTSYAGPKFKLRHDYPSGAVPPSEEYPWKKVTGGGLINQSNSMDYVNALKSYVSEDMQKLLFDYSNWNAQTEPWWQSIWLGTQREAIHGMYVGSEFDAGTLAEQNINLTTYVYTLYDATSAVTLNRIWGTDLASAENPNLSNSQVAQYEEGSFIVKFAFVTASGEEWSPMQGTATWDIYSNVDPYTGSANPGADTTIQQVYLMQCDLIVKDSEAAPETGWVFSTLVYDKDAPGENAWDKMIPLGATWGGNPDVINTDSTAINAPVAVNQNLTQNWINMNTPAYTRSTLGWDGRLSGPNDGAVVDSAMTVSKKVYPKLATVGCLGCHSAAQYTMKSFLLPAVNIPSKTVPLVIYDPGSEGWMKWFQSRDGSTPMDPGTGQIGLDYDMVTAFKAIPLWEAAMKDKVEDETLTTMK